MYQGDIFNSQELLDGIQGTDAVLIALGANPLDHTKIRARATESIVKAMKNKQANRVFCLSTSGAANSFDIMPKSSQVLFKMFLGEALKDHEATRRNFTKIQFRLDYCTTCTINRYTTNPTIPSRYTKKDKFLIPRFQELMLRILC